MFRHCLLAALTAASFICATNIASAGGTAWFETDGGNLRVLMRPYIPGDTSVRGVIDIDLLPGWKTYWRDPGSGGIPPSIQLKGDGTISVQKISFPAPKWIESAYGDYAGYDQPVEIPFVLNSNMPLTDTEISARILVGICSDICIPAFADVVLPIKEATGTDRTTIAVNAAFSALPKSPAELNVSVETIASDDQSVEIEISGEVDDLQFFVSGSNGEQFNQPEVIAQSSQSIRYKVRPLRAFKGNQIVDVMVTGINNMGAFETSTQIQFQSP